MTDGRIVTKVIDAEGNEVQATYAAPRITVSFERKIGEAHGLPQYESASAYAAVQADVDIDGTNVQAAIQEAVNAAKSAVFAALSLENSVNDAGIVAEKLVQAFSGTVESAPKRGGGGKPAPKRSTGTAGPKKSQEDLWTDLANNPGSWFDNRNDKRSAAAPDFKRAGTGEGLWLTAQDGSSNADTFGVSVPESGYKNS